MAILAFVCGNAARLVGRSDGERGQASSDGSMHNWGSLNEDPAFFYGALPFSRRLLGLSLDRRFLPALNRVEALPEALPSD